MATSTHTDDFIGRDLQNEDPGTTDPVLDYLGRETSANTDFLGRALAGGTPAPTPGSIAGTVTDAGTTDPIAGATVSIGGGVSDTTDANGDYLLTDIDPDTYTVTVSATGYVGDSESSVVVADGQDVVDVDFALTAE